MRLITLTFLLIIFSITGHAQEPDSNVVKADSITSENNDYLWGSVGVGIGRIANFANLSTAFYLPLPLPINIGLRGTFNFDLSTISNGSYPSFGESGVAFRYSSLISEQTALFGAVSFGISSGISVNPTKRFRRDSQTLEFGAIIIDDKSVALIVNAIVIRSNEITYFGIQAGVSLVTFRSK